MGMDRKMTKTVDFSSFLTYPFYSLYSLLAAGFCLAADCQLTMQVFKYCVRHNTVEPDLIVTHMLAFL